MIHIVPFPQPEELDKVYREEYYLIDKPLLLIQQKEDLDWWKPSGSHQHLNRERLLNRFPAILSYLVLAAILGILPAHVPRLDLIVVCAVTLAMCVYDFYNLVKSNEQHLAYLTVSWFAGMIAAEPQSIPGVVFQQYDLLPEKHRLAAFPGTSL